MVDLVATVLFLCVCFFNCHFSVLFLTWCCILSVSESRCPLTFVCCTKDTEFRERAFCIAMFGTLPELLKLTVCVLFLSNAISIGTF